MAKKYEGEGAYSLLAEGGETDNNPLIVKKLRAFLNQFPDDAEVAADFGCAENITSLSVHEHWFDGEKKGKILIVIE